MSSSLFFAKGPHGLGEGAIRLDTATHASAVAGPSTPAYAYSATPMLRMEDAIVETVVTQTTRTKTSFKPIALPRIHSPKAIAQPDYLAPEEYPLSRAPVPDDMRLFSLTLGDRRVLLHDQGSEPTRDAALPDLEARGPGWTRPGPTSHSSSGERRRVTLVEALRMVKGKERKRSIDGLTPGMEREAQPTILATPQSVGREGSLIRSPPRKRNRTVDEAFSAAEAAAGPLSPLPSPEPELPGPLPAARSLSPSPTIGSGIEMAALLSLPGIIAHFDALPDKLQQHVLMHLLRRSRMPTIQRVAAFTDTAIRRDFVSELPRELSVHILKFIDGPSLARVTRVSRSWQRIIDSERGVWMERLKYEGLYSGFNMEAEEERVFANRLQTLESMKKRQHALATPELGSATAAINPSHLSLERPNPLKHVYRRRHVSEQAWMNEAPRHHSIQGSGANTITCMQFDSDKLITATDQHPIEIYDIKTGQLRVELKGHEGGVWALEFFGDVLVTGSTDRTVRYWDLKTYTQTHCFHGHTSTVRCLQIIKPVLNETTGKYEPAFPIVVTGSRDASIRLWRLPQRGDPGLTGFVNDEGEEWPVMPDVNPYHLHHLEGHTGAVRAVSAHGRVCVSGSYDGTVRVWDTVTGLCTNTLTGHESKVYSVEYDRHRRRCASGSHDNTVKVWNIDTGECLHTLMGHTTLIGLLKLSPSYIVSAAADTSVRVWDAETLELKHLLTTPGSSVTCIAQDEHKVISGSDGGVKLWDIRTGELIRDLMSGAESVWQAKVVDNILVAATRPVDQNTVFEVFDFRPAQHTSGLDDASLDADSLTPWEQVPVEDPAVIADLATVKEEPESDEDEVAEVKPVRTTGPVRSKKSGRSGRRNSLLEAAAGSRADPAAGSSRRTVATRRSSRLADGTRHDDRRSRRYDQTGLAVHDQLFGRSSFFGPSDAGPSTARSQRDVSPSPSGSRASRSGGGGGSRVRASRGGSAGPWYGRTSLSTRTGSRLPSRDDSFVPDLSDDPMAGEE